jgi:spore germination protein YaaH
MKRLFFVSIIIFFLAPFSSANASSLEVAGWVPWWQETLGTQSATNQIDKLDIVYPFAVEVKADGKLNDRADLTEEKWTDLQELAEENDVLYMPTVMWFDGEQIHNILSSSKLRKKHIKEIVSLVEKGDFDGVNIDYESKKSETINHYSTFLKDLNKALGKKQLSCTIEARTPPDSLYTEVPKNLKYANDYKAIARYCDWVDIMTYDQQRADLKLNQERTGEPYIPNADKAWVNKVVDLALKDIPANKVLLGVPTYGRQWELTVEPDWFKEYKGVSAINLPDALELADDYDVKPGRNKAGEASYSFFPESSPFKVLTKAIKVPKGTTKGMEAAMQALEFANKSGMTVKVNIVWYSDAEAIKQKIEIAKKHKLKGIAIFKIDGEEDQEIWQDL